MQIFQVTFSSQNRGKIQVKNVNVLFVSKISLFITGCNLWHNRLTLSLASALGLLFCWLLVGS